MLSDFIAIFVMSDIFYIGLFRSTKIGEISDMAKYLWTIVYKHLCYLQIITLRN